MNSVAAAATPIAATTTATLGKAWPGFGNELAIVETRLTAVAHGPPARPTVTMLDVVDRYAQPFGPTLTPKTLVSPLTTWVTVAGVLVRSMRSSTPPYPPTHSAVALPAEVVAATATPVGSPGVASAVAVGGCAPAVPLICSTGPWATAA